MAPFTPASLSRDIPSSVVVFLVALPLCMGIAIASGVPPERGLITGIIGGIIVGLLAGSPLQVSGPAAGLAVIVFEFVREHGVDMLGPVMVAAGVLQIIAGGLKVGGWFRAISPAVVHGMLAGIGVLIVLAQVHVLTDALPRASGLDNLVAIPGAFFDFVTGEGNRVGAVTVGLSTIVAMIGWEKIRPANLKMVPGALIGVVAGTLVAVIGGLVVKRVHVPENILSSLVAPTPDQWSRLYEPTMIVMALTLAVIASAESLLSAAAVDRMHEGPRTQYNRELAAQGAGNMLCGFAGGLPMTGVIVRSSANVQAGALTRASTILHGIWILAFLMVLPWVLAVVPTATLAGILVVTGIRLVSVEHVMHLQKRYGFATAAIWAATMIMVVGTDLLTGVLVGLGLSLLQVVPYLLKGRLKLETGAAEAALPSGETTAVPELRLSGSATFLQLPQLNQALENTPTGGQVRLQADKLHHVDHTCLELIQEWAARHRKKGTRVEIVGGSPSLRKQLTDAIGQAPAH